MFQIYLGYKRKTVYEEFFGIKKGYYWRCESLKVTNPDFSNLLGKSGLFGKQCVTEKFQKSRVKQEPLWPLGKIIVMEFRKTEHSRNQDSTVRTMDGKLKRLAFWVALSYVNFK